MRISEEITVCAREGCRGPVMWEVARVAQAKGLGPGSPVEQSLTAEPRPRSASERVNGVARVTASHPTTVREPHAPH